MADSTLLGPEGPDAGVRAGLPPVRGVARGGCGRVGLSRGVLHRTASSAALVPCVGAGGVGRGAAVGVGVSCSFFENCTVDASIFVVKLVRAHGGCLGTRSR